VGREEGLGTAGDGAERCPVGSPFETLLGSLKGMVNFDVRRRIELPTFALRIRMPNHHIKGSLTIFWIIGTILRHDRPKNDC